MNISGDMILMSTFSGTLLMDNSRDKLDGSRRSLSWPLGIGITWPCKKCAGMCPVASSYGIKDVDQMYNEGGSSKMQVLSLSDTTG